MSDVRYSIRLLLKNPGFSLVAALSLALGIGANTAIFTLLDAVLLRNLPVRNPRELVMLGKGAWSGIGDEFPSGPTELFAYPFYRQLREQNQVFSDVLALQSFGTRAYVRLSGTNRAPVPVETQLVSGNYFSMLGVNPILGHVFSTADDATPGSRPVAVISYACWRRLFGTSPAALSRTVTMGQTIFEIVGVAPPEFFGTTVGLYPDIWIPLSMQAEVPPGFKALSDRRQQFLYVIGRLKPGVSAAQAAAGTNLIFRRYFENLTGTAISPENKRKLERAVVELTSASKGISSLRRQFSLSLQVLMAVVGLVLLIACGNVANLLLARATARQKEVALRLAIGAGRGRLVRQFLTESLVLATVGGACGILLAIWGSHILLRLVSGSSNPIPLQISTDLGMLGFTVAVSMLTGLLFGMAPALRVTRLELSPALKEGKATSNVPARGRFGRVMVAGQVSLSLLLLIGAGLFARSLRNLESIDTGFLRQSVLRFKLNTDSSGYQEDQHLVSLYQKVEQRLESIAGVKAASFSFFSFNEGNWTAGISLPGANQLSERDREVHGNVVGPKFFETMGLPMLIGRRFGPRDTASSPKVAVINEAWVHHFWPHDYPLGKRFGLDGDQQKADVEVIGVVKNAKYQSVRENVPPMMYLPFTQRAQYLNDLEVNVTGDPLLMIPRIRQALAEVEPNLPVSDVATMAAVVDQSLARELLIAKLSGFFGLLALALACVGLYGTMSYAVARRTNEIGIRMALGAQRGLVLRQVLRESLLLVAIGAGCGIPVAFAAQRLIAGLLFGLKTADPFTFVSATLALALVVLFAAYVPARRASRVDPIVALRHE